MCNRDSLGLARGFRRALLALVLATVACGGEGSREPAAGLPPAAGPPLGDDEVKQAVSRLLRPVEPIALPAPRLPTTADVVRLNGRLGDALIEASAVEGVDDRDLVSLGPAATRSPAAGAEVRRTREVGGLVYEWLRLTGFEARAEEVGEILLTARFENAEHFVLSWGPFGSLRIEVQEPGEESEYVISTEGLTDWKGRLEAIRIGVLQADPEAEAGIEIRSLRLRDRRSAFAEAVGVSRRRVGREVRNATFLHGSTRLRYPALTLPRPARLSFGAAVLDGPVVLKIALADAAGETVLFDEEIASTGEWRDLNLPLPEVTSEPIDLVVELAGPAEEVLFFAEPVFYRPWDSPPRVLVYLIDTLGAPHMSLYGYDRPTTPRLDRLAAEGVWFANAFANSSWTPESVPILMTSLLSRSNGVFKKFSKLAPDFVTLQEVFAAAGYATAAFSTNGNAGPARGTDQGFDSFFDHIGHARDETALRTVPIPHVLRWMQSHRDRPTFVYVHTAEPHDPYGPPPPYDTLFDPDYAGEVDGAWKPTPLARRRGLVDPRDVEHLKALYDGEVAFADRMFGALMDPLEDRGLLDEALVVVTADHGEGLGQHGLFGHAVALYPELLRIPLIFWGPGRLRPVGRVEPNVQLLDVMPTLLELTGLDAEIPLQGDSLVPLLEGGDESRWSDRPLVASLYASDPPQLSIIQGSWKLDFLATGASGPRFRLFDIARDPGETEDLLGLYTDTGRRMIRQLVDSYSRIPRYAAGVSSRFEISNEQLDRLRALGYVD